MSALVGISCDGCSAMLHTTTILQASVGPVRAEAKTRGWHKTRGVFTFQTGTTYGYTRDICPECWAKGTR